MNWAFILIIPLIIVAWRRREWGVLLLLAILQAYGIRATILGIPTTLLELSLYAVAVISLVRGDWRRVSFVKIMDRYSWWLLPPLIWLGAAIISTLVAPDIRTAAGVLKGWIVDPLILSMLVVRYAELLQEPQKWWRNVIGALLVGVVVTTAHGCIQSFLQHLTRLQSGGDSPNVLAMYLVPIVVMSVVWCMDAERRKILGKWLGFWLGAVGFVVLGVLWTGSYGGWLALVGAIVVSIFWVWPKMTRKLRVLMGVTLVLAGLLLPWFVVYQGTWPTASHRNQTYGITSGEVRLVLWKEALHQVSTKPFLGQGLGQWQGEFTAFAQEQGLLSVRNPGLAIELAHSSLFPHQLWLTTWLSLGLMGVAALALVVLLIFSGVGAMAVVPMAAVTAILVHGMVDTPAFKNDLSVLLWVAYVMAMCVTVANKQSKSYGR